MTGVDYAFIAIIAVSTLISLFRGFVKEALSLVTWVAAVWIGIAFADLFAPMFEPALSRPELRQLAAFGVLFIVIIILGEKTGLSGTDRALGMVFGLARGAALVTALIMLGGLVGGPGQGNWDAWRESRLVPYFQPLAGWMQGFFEAQAEQHLEDVGT